MQQKPAFPSKSPPIVKRAIPFIFLLVGAVFLIVGIVFLNSAKSFRTNSVRAELLVTLVDSKRSDNGMVYRPTFQATGPDGQTIEHTGSLWVSPKPHYQGDRVTGLANWDTGELRSETMQKRGFLFGLIFALVGGTAFCVGGGIAFYMRRERTVEHYN